MKQLISHKGNVSLVDVPTPTCRRGEVLVHNSYSAVSAGTELSGISGGAVPLWKRAISRPENIRKVVNLVAEKGVGQARKIVKTKVDTGGLLGYSSAGTVIEVSENVNEFKRGDKVACAGQPHAEVIAVPENLVVNIPEGLELKYASTVTLGAIALQGVRRASPTIGEVFVVFGLGILGQITSQILKANGCQVIGIDLNHIRLELAVSQGADFCFNNSEADVISEIFIKTRGFGADGVIITAASKSDDILSTAFKICRKKGRVVVVGDVGLNITRQDIYAKELDFFISTSYGPGRYEKGYEELGLDYPIGYVRWTENRNMGEYLRLLKQGVVNIEPLIGEIYDFSNAAQAYESLKEGSDASPIAILKYADDGSDEQKEVHIGGIHSKRLDRDKIRVAIIGAGSFVKSTHLPNLSALSKDFEIHAIVNRNSHTARSLAEHYNARYCSSDYREVLSDPDVDAVFITTRHNMHGPLTTEALRANKHVFVEKPLCLNEDELDGILDCYSEIENPQSEIPLLMTGFNRRFSPYVVRIKKILKDSSHPVIINYVMNAGYADREHWVHGEEGGGRNIGEACHIYDLFMALVGSGIENIGATGISKGLDFYHSNDNFVSTFRFEDGSIATLTYTAMGSQKYPKETMHIFCDGKVIYLDDYRRLQVFGVRSKGMTTRTQQKGHLEELKAFAEAIKDKGEWPIPLENQVSAMRAAFAIEKKLRA